VQTVKPASGIRRPASGKKSQSGWTRRAFMAVLALAAVALPRRKLADKPKPIWIGHH